MDAECVMLDFAFARGGEVWDHFCCVVAWTVLEQQRASILRFLRTLDDVDAVPIEFPRYSRPGEVDTADIIGMARLSQHGEIIFHAFSWKVALEIQRERGDKDPPKADFVALLRCSLPTLKQFIIDLYAADS